MVIEGREIYARVALVLILMGLPLILLGYQLLLPAFSEGQLVNIHMWMPQDGGLSQDVIHVDTDENLTIRFYAEDVTHGIAIGPDLGVDLGAIEPGKMKEVTLSFPRAGTYTYYCTTWCGDDHWRMRGQIIVRDPNQPNAIPSVESDPYIANLEAEHIHIDDARTIFTPLQAVNLLPISSLEAWVIPNDLADKEWQRRHSPAEASEILAAANPEQSLELVYQAVAALWLADSPDDAIDAQYLYEQNCAACHGQRGLSEGIAAFTTNVQPQAFGIPAYMFNMRSDVLYAKIRRGGMGTDMPNFGTVFSREETWALVDYLWILAFQN